jgi:hypothetical protein
MNKQKQVVNLVRSIMRLHGKTQVWNNLYDKGVRTVKCYRDRNDATNQDWNLHQVLQQTLNGLNIVHQIKYTEPSGGPFNPGTGGFIVRLPVLD